MSGRGGATETTLTKVARRKKLFLSAFARKACDVTAACKATAIGRSQVYAWRRADPEFESAFIEAIEQDLDFTESQLKKNIKAGKEASIFFHLKCKGKKRGWVERQEITGADGVPFHGATEEEEKRLRELPLEDLRRVRDIIRGNGEIPPPPDGPGREDHRGEEPPRIH